MKKDIVIIALIAILFVLIAGSILASFAFYKEYKDKTDAMEQQSQADRSKTESLEAKIGSFKSTVDDISSQVKTHGDTLKFVQNSVNISEEERKNLLDKIEEIKKGLQGIQKDYSSAVVDIRQNIMVLKDNLDKIGSKPKEVELGKITVKQDEKKDAKTGSPSLAVKSGGSNFKSGNVRKVGSY
jgi:chromosome segregation ATPase